MALGDFTAFVPCRERRWEGASTFNISTATLKVMLINGATEPDRDTVDFIDDLNSREVTGSNYTAGGATLANVTFAPPGTPDGYVYLDADDVSWLQHASGFNDARWAILYYDSGTAATSDAIGYLDLGANQSNQTTDFEIRWNATAMGRF